MLFVKTLADEKILSKELHKDMQAGLKSCFWPK